MSADVIVIGAGLAGLRAARVLARGDLQVVRSTAALLTELEHAWRGRIDRIDALLDQLKE